MKTRKPTKIEKKKLKVMCERVIDMYGVNGFGWLLALVLDGTRYFAGDENEFDIDAITIKFNGGYPTTWHCDNCKFDHYEYKKEVN